MPNQPRNPARNVRVSDELWRRVKTLAADNGETVSDVIRRALEKYTTKDPPVPHCDYEGPNP